MTYNNRHSVWFYMWKSTWDSSCLALACIAFWLSIAILIIYYGFPTIRVWVSWDKAIIENVNNLITSVCSGYMVTYIFYILTTLIPFATKMQHKRVALEENARCLKDALYDLLNNLCEFCNEQTEITDDDWTVFRERNCYESSGQTKNRYQLKQDSKNFLNEKSRYIRDYLKSMEEELKYFYKTERKMLLSLEFAPMWQTMEQISSNVIFSSDAYKSFLNQTLASYQCSISLYNLLQDKKGIELMECYDVSLKGCNNKVCSLISIVNFNNK